MNLKSLKRIVKESVVEKLLSRRLSLLFRIRQENGISISELFEDIIESLDDYEFKKVLKSVRHKYAYKQED